MPTTYEWAVNEMDGEDIHENYFTETLKHSEFTPSQIDGKRYRLELIKTIGNDEQGVTDRYYAQVKTTDQLTLTPHFENGGGAVPKRFFTELERWNSNNKTKAA